MSDTPRTDAFCCDTIDADRNTVYGALWAWARTLERELAGGNAYAVLLHGLLREARENLGHIDHSDLYSRICVALAKNPATAHESPAPTNADVRKPETVGAGPDTVLTMEIPK
jgi:hypothetical protein